MYACPALAHSGFTLLTYTPISKSHVYASLEYRSIGVIDKKDTDDGSKQEKEEEEHKQGIAKHDVFGMNIKAKDVGDDGDVRAMDTSMQVLHMVKDVQCKTRFHCNTHLSTAFLLHLGSSCYEYKALQSRKRYQLN